ncbi:MAG: MFS transporter, partial [Deltaproteobacteria bacterium]|nr:MFS transporter [Deltaproteobacteria bacterium]
MPMDGTVSKRSALFIATLSAFINPFFGSATQIALPSIAKDFHMDAILLSWVATSYILATVVSLVPSGRLADIHGRKKVFLYGYILFTISSLLCGLSTSGAMLISFRVLQGIGSAMHFATGIAILISVYPPHQRGRVLGITVAAVYTGLSLGPFLGGLLTEYLTWRSVF